MQLLTIKNSHLTPADNIFMFRSWEASFGSFLYDLIIIWLVSCCLCDSCRMRAKLQKEICYPPP